MENATALTVSEFIEMIKPDMARSLSLSDVMKIMFPPDTGKALYEETVIVTYRLPEFIRTPSGSREISLLFDFDTLTKGTREKNEC